MQEEPTKIEETVDSIKDYLNTRYELVTLRAADKLSRVTSNVLSYLPIIFLVVLTIVMASVGLSLYLNQVLQSDFSGFFVVGGVYLLTGLILVLIRKDSLAKPFRNKIIRELFRNSNT